MVMNATITAMKNERIIAGERMADPVNYSNMILKGENYITKDTKNTEYFLDKEPSYVFIIKGAKCNNIDCFLLQI